MAVQKNNEQVGKYLIFLSSNRRFAIGFENIEVIIVPKEIVPIPEFPSYFAGTCTNNGKVVPVIDARSRFGFEKGEITERSCVIISYAHKGDEVLQVGILVDTISVMADVEESRIEPCVAINSEAYTRYLLGVFVENDEPCYIVSPDLMINDSDREVIEN